MRLASPLEPGARAAGSHPLVYKSKLWPFPFPANPKSAYKTWRFTNRTQPWNQAKLGEHKQQKPDPQSSPENSPKQSIKMQTYENH